MITCLIKAPLSFHAVNPVGRIINRFSQDSNSLDELLPFLSYSFCHYIAPAVTTTILAIITNQWLIVPILVSLALFYFFGNVFFVSSSDIKRLMLMAAGPICSHFSNTMEGLRTIRVQKKQQEFTDEIYRYVDLL